MKSLLPRSAPAVCAAIAASVLLLFWNHELVTVYRVLTAWGVRPFRFPFLDLDTILSALRCRRLGLDVFTVNPCDALGRLFDYSPLWLTLSIFPVTTNWIVPVGVAVDAAFVCSLLLLPPGRGLLQIVVICLCVLSTPVAFAMERGNNDLIIFILAATAAALASRSLRFRVVGYGFALLAGMLKYYPALVLALLCRERSRAFVPVFLAGLALLLGFVALEWNDLRRALPLIPVGQYFGDMFGARTLPFGLVDALDLPPIVARPTLMGLVAAAISAAVRIGLLARADLERLTEHERLFLLTGALLILGCFFSAQNIGYRALHLLLAAPALTALATVARRRVLYRVSVGVLLVLLWSDCWRHGLEAVLQHLPLWDETTSTAGSPALLLGWLLRELCWWWSVTLLAGLSFGILLETPVGRAALPSFGGDSRPRFAAA